MAACPVLLLLHLVLYRLHRIFLFSLSHHTSTPALYTLSHTTLFRSTRAARACRRTFPARWRGLPWPPNATTSRKVLRQDRKSTRLNSSHVSISYAVFCLKKKKQTIRLGWTQASRGREENLCARKRR